MYRQLLIAGLVAGASLTAGGIAAVWTMEKSPAEPHSDLDHKLKPIARSVQAASWNEHGGAVRAPLVVAPAAARPHPAPLAAATPAMPTLLAVAATATAADEPALPVATRGAAHCALSGNCSPALAGGNNAPRAGRPGASLAAAGRAGASLAAAGRPGASLAAAGRAGASLAAAGRPGAPLAAAGTLPLASAGAPAARPSAAPAALSAPAPSVAMLLADTTPLVPTTVVEAVEYGRAGGPRDVLGQAREIPGSLPPAVPLPVPVPAPASRDSSAVAPGGEGDANTGAPFAALAPTQPAGSPSASPLSISSPIVELASGPQVVRQLDPSGKGPGALLEQVVSAAADSAVGEPSTNFLLLVAMLGAAVMVRRRVP